MFIYIYIYTYVYIYIYILHSRVPISCAWPSPTDPRSSAARSCARRRPAAPRVARQARRADRNG